MRRLKTDLPGLRQVGRAQIMQACVQISPLYTTMKEQKLTVNMCTDHSEVDFSMYLLKLGQVRERIYEEEGENKVKIPDEHITNCLQDLITFPDLEHSCNGPDHLIEGTSYTPLHKNVKEIHDYCISKYPEEAKEYLSADSIFEDNNKDAMPTKFIINSIAPTGLPDH